MPHPVAMHQARSHAYASACSLLHASHCSLINASPALGCTLVAGPQLTQIPTSCHCLLHAHCWSLVHSRCYSSLQAWHCSSLHACRWSLLHACHCSGARGNTCDQSGARGNAHAWVYVCSRLIESRQSSLIQGSHLKKKLRQKSLHFSSCLNASNGMSMLQYVPAKGGKHSDLRCCNYAHYHVHIRGLQGSLLLLGQMDDLLHAAQARERHSASQHYIYARDQLWTLAPFPGQSC